MGAFGFWQWVVVLLIVVIFFGRGKLRNFGSDLGASIRGFKKGLQDEETENLQNDIQEASTAETVASEEKV